MFTTVVIILFALLLFFFIAIPLLFPKQTEAVPHDSDPLVDELQEELEALLRAIKELDVRDDLKEEKSVSLRQRYEVKAARVLRALEDRQSELQGIKTPITQSVSNKRTLPYGILGLLGLMLISGTVMGTYVLPRIGDSTVTTAFSSQLNAGRDLKRLEQAVSKDATVEKQLALADKYWQIASDFEDDSRFFQAAEIYEALIIEGQEIPAKAYYRLGLTQFETLPERALSNVEIAYSLDPNDEDIQFSLAEAFFAVGRLEEAKPLYDVILKTEAGNNNRVAIEERISFINILAPKLAAAQNRPSEETLMSLGDAFWELELRQDAEIAYGQVLMEYNKNNARALSHIGQKSFFDGNNEQAIGFLTAARAIEVESGIKNLKTLLFLGNAYFSINQLESAIVVWKDYVVVAGGEESAGRVPSLIVNAQARLDGTAPIETASDSLGALNPIVEITSTGKELYQQSCASCHGAAGQGSLGPRLMGNRTSSDKLRVSQIISNGKGMMPAFGFILEETEIDAIASFVFDSFGGN